MELNLKEINFIEKIYNEMYAPLYTYALHSLCDSTLSEEAVQDTFQIACTRIGDIMQSENPEGWLTNTLKNVIRNAWRKRARFAAKVMTTSPFEETPGNAIYTDEEDIDITFSDLVEDKDYVLLKKVALEKYTIKETAAYFNISVDSCKKRIQRAKKRFRKLFK